MTDVLPELSWKVRWTDEFIVIEARGELDVYTAPSLREALLDLLATSDRKIAIDLSELTFLDSTGIGVFIAAHRRGVAHGTDVVLARPRPSVARALEITGVDKAMAVLDGDDAP